MTQMMKLDVIDRSQARNLCGDDIVHHPDTKRYVRVSRLVHGDTHVGVIAVDVETDEWVVFSVANGRQFNIYAE